MSIFTARPEVILNEYPLRGVWFHGNQLLYADEYKLIGLGLNGNATGLILEDPYAAQCKKYYSAGSFSIVFVISQVCVNSTKTRLTARSQEATTVWDITSTPPKILYGWYRNDNTYDYLHFSADDQTLFMLNKLKRGCIQAINSNTFEEIRTIHVTDNHLLKMSIGGNMAAVVAEKHGIFW